MRWDTHLLGWSDAGAVRFTDNDLLRNTLVVGPPRKGKTNMVLGWCTYLMDMRRDVGQMIFDGAWKLGANIMLAQDARVRELLAAGDIEGAEAEMDRVILVRANTINSGGLTLDLFRPQLIRDELGILRAETPAEKAEIPLASLATNTRDADMMELVKTYGLMGFTLLFAADFELSAMDDLLTWNNLAFDAELRSAIEKNFNAMHARTLDLSSRIRLPRTHPGAAIQELWFELQRLRSETAKSSKDFAAQVGSTRRHFAWLTKNPLFSRDGVDLAQFLDDGGIFIFDTSNLNPLLAGKMRGGLYAWDVARKKTAFAPRDSVVVVDEQEGMMPETIAPYLGTSRNRNHHHWLLFQKPNQIGRNGEYFEAIRAGMQREIYFGAGTRAFAEELLSFDRNLRADAYYLPNVSQTRSETENESFTDTNGDGSSDGGAYADGDGGHESREITRIDDTGIMRREHMDISRPGSGRSSSNWNTNAFRAQAHARGRAKNRGETTSYDRVPLGEVLRLCIPEILTMEVGTAIHLPPEGDPEIIEHRLIPEPLKTFPDARERLQQALLRQAQRAAAMHAHPDPPLGAPRTDAAPIESIFEDEASSAHTETRRKPAWLD